MDHDKKIVLFGAGGYGRTALKYFGQSRVYCFVDNNERLVGKRIHDIPVISFPQLKDIYNDYQIVISAPIEYALPIAAQLEDAGITRYEIFPRILQGESVKQTTEITIQNPLALNLDEKNRVLMVTYIFPPVSGAGVFRSIKFAKYLPQCGWYPTVIASNMEPNYIYWDESLLKEIPAGVPVIRIPDIISTFQEGFTPEQEKQLLKFLGDIFQESQEAYALYTSFLESRTGIAKLLVFPCYALLWAYKTIHYVESTMDIRNFRVIYTSSAPYSAHLVGYYFKHRYGIPWVADYRDPWTNSSRQSLPDKSDYQLLFFLESILLRNADCNITVDFLGGIENYISRFHLSEKKIVSIANGYDEEDFAQFSAKLSRTTKFTINYSGLISSNNRNIDPILMSLQELIAEGQIDSEKVQFRIVGDVRTEDPDLMARKYNLESILVQTGYVTHSEAIRSNIEANLLLHLVGEDEKHQHVVTGKIFDYLRSGRPILSIAPPGGSVDQILRETGHGKAFVSTQIPEIKAMILQEYRKWQSGEISELLHSPHIEKYERKALTKQLVQVFENVKN